MTYVHVEQVEDMIKSWQAECANHPAIYNQGNVLRDRLDKLTADIETPIDWPTNARLIAAAPELLAAAKEALAILRGEGAPGWGAAKDILGTAIAKAVPPLPAVEGI